MDYYKRYLESQPEYEFVGLYADEGISGGQLKKREGFLRMLQDAKAGMIDVIYTKSISRFGRNTVDCLESVRTLKKYGVNVVFEKEHIETMKAEGEVLMTVLMALAQNEVHTLSENVKWGMRRKYERGDTSSVPIGNFIAYEKDDAGNWVIKEEGAETVRRIFDLYLQGHSHNAIAGILTEEGRKPERRDEGWSASSVRGILRNEKMVGDMLLQKRYSTDYLSKKIRWNRGDLPQYYVSNTHKGIIDRETWDAANEMYERDKVFSKQHHLGNNYCRRALKQLPLSGKCVCKECGYAFGRKDKKRGYKYVNEYYWVCGSFYAKPPVRLHEQYRVPDERFHELFVEAWNELVVNKDMYLQQPETAVQRYKQKELDRLVAEKGMIETIEYELVISTLDHIDIGMDGYADVYFYAGAKITIKI